jgi:outer membrane assembly lipoprotein YfiO
MTIDRTLRVTLCMLGLLAMGACATRTVHPSELPADEIYRTGMEAFEANRTEDALRFLEYFVQAHFGDARVPEVQFTIGEAYDRRREHISAASAFQRLVSDFPTHELAPDARLRICEAYVSVSPRPELDQRYTRIAITHCEAVIRNHPQTPLAQQAETRIQEMQEKLATKAYQTGVFYQRRRAFDSAVIYFREAVDEHPRTSVAPRALRGLVESYEAMGYEEDAEEARRRLLRDYPESPDAQALRG